MTILALDTAVSSALKSGAMFSIQDRSRSSDRPQSRPLPNRINLRKRSSGSTFHQMNLESVNSAFLSGLFADVAQVGTTTEVQPSKKSRISKTKSMVRCGRSYKQLVSIQEGLNEASVHTDILPECSASPVQANTSFFTERQDSLHYQLDCVSSSSSCSATDTSSSSTGANLAFPHLPKTISNSTPSCNKQLTRVVSDLQSSVSENSEKNESYGWFVEMEDEQSKNNDVAAADPYAVAARTQGLAFQAPTAPKADNQDAEVEWAKAADTVDDVLGDFF